MILVDTSVWIEHFRKANPGLVSVLEDQEVVAHPLVIGEIACGTMPDRDGVLRLLEGLPQAKVATHAEALHLISSNLLMGRGIGYIDVHLLVSARLTEDTVIWTNDRRLAAVAESLGLNFADPR